MEWDIHIKEKVYHRLANEIFFRIYDERYSLGAKLPSFPEFAKEAGSSPETARKAIFELLRRGVVIKTPRGYFVTSEREKVLEYRDRYLAVLEREYLAGKQKVNC